MKSMRYVQSITSGKIVIENLEKYSGRDVEIIIIPLVKHKTSRKPAVTSASDIFGMFRHRRLDRPVSIEEMEAAVRERRKHDCT